MCIANGEYNFMENYAKNPISFKKVKCTLNVLVVDNKNNFQGGKYSFQLLLTKRNK